MTDLQALASSPLQFAKRFIRYKGQPLELHPWQERFASETNFLRDFVLLRASRQCGKSWLVSILTLAYALMHPGLTVHIFSASWRQSGNIYGYIRRLVDQSPEIAGKVKPRGNRKYELAFRNGSRITHATAGLDGKGALGFSCEGRGFVLLDECAYIRSEAAHSILPIANNAGLVLVSTPRFPSGFFYDCSRNEHFKKYHLPAKVSPLYTEERLSAIHDLLPPAQWRQDYLAEFAVGGAEAVFDAEAVDDAIDKSLPVFDPHAPFTSYEHNKNYVWSLDPSKLKHDLTVFMIGDYDLQNNHLSVVAYHVFAGTYQAKIDSPYRPVATFTDSHDEVIRTIESYHAKYHPTKFYIDSSDMYYANEFKKRVYPVQECKWTVQTKEQYIEHLSAALNSRKLSLPADEALVNELLTFSYDLQEMQNGGQRKRYAETMDDRTDALAMLSLAVTTGPQKQWHDFIEAF